MHTFRTLDKQIGLVPAAITRTLGEIDTSRGRKDAFRRQRPQILDALVDAARIQSTEASNGIEGVVAPHDASTSSSRTRRRRATAPRRRSRATARCSTRFTRARWTSRFRPSVVEQLHCEMYAFTSVPAGHWKNFDNAISETLPDGSTRVRFQTVPAMATATAMKELHQRFLDERDAGNHHPLLVIGYYVFDFLAIHPFRDGNGRMARLLTLLALYQDGYTVGRYVSLERLVIETRVSYYESLQAAGHGWHEDQHDIRPWLEYLLGVILAAYREFEQRVGSVSGGRGAKTAAIEQFVRDGIAAEFTIADVRAAALGASDSMIAKVLTRLRDEGAITSLGTGRSARWRRGS